MDEEGVQIKSFIPSEFSSQSPSQLVDLEWPLHISLNTSRQLSLLVSIYRMKSSSNPEIVGLIFKMLGTETEIDGMSDDVGAKGVSIFRILKGVVPDIFCTLQT